MESSAGRITPRALLIAVALTMLCGFWVRQAEIVVLATQVTESVPPIPALAALLILAALNPALRRVGQRFALTRAEQLTIYCFVAIAITTLACGALRFWLSMVSAPFYFATPQNKIATLYRYFPSWLVVKNPELIRQLYEGSPTGAVPWRAWAVPLTAWTVFFMALWIAMLCLVRLVHRRWIESERLTFPIVKLPLEATMVNAGQRPFLKDPVMWCGFALAALYNLNNILSAVFPSIPCPGKSLDLNPFLSSPPWSSLQPLTLYYRPELIGFGFLVPSDICFSIWFFFLMTRLEGLVGHLFGWDFPGMPYDQEQSMGSYLLLGSWLLWQVRGDIVGPAAGWWQNLRGRWRSRSRNWAHALRCDGQAPPGWTTPGFLISFGILCWFCREAGMALWVAALFLGIVLLTALVCARIRAEAGIPLIWLFPFYQSKKILFYTLGSSAFLTGGLPATLTIFALLTFLSRGFYPAFIGYQIESLKIADEARIPRGRMCALIIGAGLFGLLIGFYFPIATYYHYGAQHLGGMWGWDMPVQEFAQAAAASTSPQFPDSHRIWATVFGGVLTAVLLALRRSFVGFPLHPLGYAVATAYGTLVWWSFFVVWVLKSIILKIGGGRLYRRAIPFFLGFALGHFFLAGMIWGLIGAFWREGAHAYAVWFG
ncbi:MAG TPA: DUF6785 family protein [Armatimonadota bacterium]|nr:DUF6785 family protein [Armatimonadota bacterium]